MRSLGPEMPGQFVCPGRQKGIDGNPDQIGHIVQIDSLNVLVHDLHLVPGRGRRRQRGQRFRRHQVVFDDRLGRAEFTPGKNKFDSHATMASILRAVDGILCVTK
jgi:hypothetical protein